MSIFVYKEKCLPYKTFISMDFYQEMHHKKVIEGKVIEIPIFLHSSKKRPKLAGGFTKKALRLQELFIKMNLCRIL